MDSAVNIYIKLKPNEKSELISISRDQGEIRFQDSNSHTYSFSRIFPQEIQIQEIFDATTKPLVNLVKVGTNSVVLAYGHKSTGKMTCMFGNEKNGLFQLAMENLTEFSQEAESLKEVVISLSIIELVEDNIRDLGLSVTHPNDFDTFKNGIETEENVGKISIPDAKVFEIKTAIEARNIIDQCLEFRKRFELGFGEYSDKAHTFAILTLKQKSKAST